MHRVRILLVLAFVAPGAACNASEPAAPPAPAPRAAPRPPKRPPATPAPDTGTCVVRATGAATFEQTTQGGTSTINTWHWVSARDRENVAPFILNCGGAHASVSFVAKADEVAYGPKRYPIAPGGPPGPDPMITVGGALLAFPAGHFEITAFDGTHIAGAFEIAGKLTGKREGEAITLAGTFDYRCPSVWACGK